MQAIVLYGNDFHILRFGEDVLESSANWITRLAASNASGMSLQQWESLRSSTAEPSFAGNAAQWKILDVGTGNGLLLHALARRGWVIYEYTGYIN